MAETNTLSFCTYDDLHPRGEIQNYTFSTKEELQTLVETIWNKVWGTENIMDKNENKNEDKEYYIPHFEQYASVEEIVPSLLGENYCVYNRVEKYYVVAFAINYTRFWIWSKDCEAKIIKWREEDKEDPIINNLDPDYDVNPVIKILSSFHSS